MVRIAFFIGFLGLFIGGIVPVSAYADDSAYYIKDVQVDVLDESAVKARNKAFIEAQKKAFLLLAAKFEPAETVATLKPPSDDILSSLIQDFEISSEQLSTKRYVGVFAFRFKQAAVNQYFGHSPSLTSEDAPASVSKTLLLPFTQELQKSPQIVKVRNPYLTMLQADLPVGGAYILPAGNISDITDIGREEPPMLSPAAMRRLMARYEVQDIKIAVVHIDPKNQRSVEIDIYNTSKGTQVMRAKTIIVETSKASQSTYQALTDTLSDEKLDDPDEVETAKKLESEINPEPFMPKTRTLPIDSMRAARHSNNQYHMQNEDRQAAADPQSEISVKVFFTNMQEWVSIQRQLSGIDGIKNIRIVSLKTNQVDLTVGYEDWSRFTTSLQKNGLTMEQQAERSYILKNIGGNF